MQFEQSGYDFYIDDILNVVDLSADRRWKLNNLSYPNQWVLSYTVNGDSIVYQMNDTTVPVKKNSILFFPVNFQRSAICDSDEPASHGQCVQFLRCHQIQHETGKQGNG